MNLIDVFPLKNETYTINFLGKEVQIPRQFSFIEFSNGKNPELLEIFVAIDIDSTEVKIAEFELRKCEAELDICVCFSLFEENNFFDIITEKENIFTVVQHKENYFLWQDIENTLFNIQPELASF